MYVKTFAEMRAAQEPTIAKMEEVARRLRKGAIHPGRAVEILRELADRIESEDGVW